MSEALVEKRMSKLGLRFPFMVGPMVGISHLAFREWIRSYTPSSISALVFTEMLSSRRIPNERIELCPHLKTAPFEPYFVPQLLGNEERFVAPSVQKLLTLAPWGIDINMGCPVKKTIGHNWGVRLMGDKNYAANIVRFTKAHSSVPISVKLRAGLDDKINLDYLDDFTLALEEAGADWLTIHCRSQRQRHSGIGNWEVVSDIAKRRKIPIVLNGDIQTAEDALSAMNDTAVDGAMIGRAATARPWILWQIAFKLGLTPEKPPLTPEEEGAEYFRALYRLANLLSEHYGETFDIHRRFLFVVAMDHSWMKFGHTTWTALKRSKNLEEAKAILLALAETSTDTMGRRVNH